MKNNKQFISIAICATLLSISACQMPADPPPNSDDLYELRDSIRSEISLRLGNAKQEINRQAEMMRRRAWSEDKQTAARLRKKAERMEAKYEELDAWVDSLKNDSVMGDWYLHRQKINILLDDLGIELNTLL